MKRRTVLGGLGVTGLAGLAGCLGLVGMNEHESSPAGVEADVREDTSYEQTEIDTIVVEEEVGISGYSETISVTNYTTEHEKAVSLPAVGDLRAAIFIVLTSPQIGAAGRNFNPVEEMSSTELVEMVEDNYDDINDISHEEDDEITILEETTTRSRFTAEARFDGHDLEVDIHVTEAVEADDDLLVTIGVYPQEVRDEEEDNVFSLIEGVTTDVDPDGDDADVDGDDNEGNESDFDENDFDSDDFDENDTDEYDTDEYEESDDDDDAGSISL